MGSVRSARVQIEGKTFDLTFEKLRQGGFMEILEKGKKVCRRATFPATMARWICGFLGPDAADKVNFERKKVSGRMLGWVKRKSNSKGWFFDLGFRLRGRSKSIFVPGASDFD